MLNIFILVTVVVLNLFLSFLVFKRSKNNKANLLFSLMVFSSVPWAIVNYLADLKTIEYSTSLLISRLSFVSGIGISGLFFIFALNFYRETKNSEKIERLVLGFATLIFLLSFTRLIVSGLSEQSWGWDIVPGPLYFLYVGFFALTVAGAFAVLLAKYKNSTGIYRNQLKFILAGTVITAVISATTNMFLPLMTGTNPYAKYGAYSFLFLIAFTSYAIVKHRLMDIRMVVARSVAYSSLLIVLASFYAGSVLGIQALFFPNEIEGFDFAQGAVRTVIAVVMVFLFQPLKRWITRITDSIFFKNVYDPEAFLDKFAHTAGASIVLIELLYKSLDLILTQIKITRGLVLVLTDTGAIYTSQMVGYKEAPKIDEADIHRLVRDGVLVYDELEETSRFKHLMRKYDASVVVPIKTNSDTEGILFLGEKLSGDMYSAQDLRVFEILAPEMAVAVANAKSYEKIEKFNVTLRQEVKKATSELEKKNEQLRELDKAKDEFISMASHQLRTPLTAIKGYLSMLLEGDAGEIKVSQYDFVNEAFQGANRMVGLINDLLNVSRMETGRFFLEPVEVDMTKLVEEEVKQLSNHAKEKHLYLKTVFKGKIPPIMADETKIRQVVMNFIDNAVYYTTSGGVTVHMKKEGSDVVFEVHDTGIGVPKAAQKQLFQKFYRADNARHVRPDGTGLGIYLAKKVVDDHHGKLIFKSTEGKGSVFGFRFPIKSKLSNKRISAPAPTAPGSSPAIGELAAGIGVSAESLAATSKESNKSVDEVPIDKTPTESAKELIQEAELARANQEK